MNQDQVNRLEDEIERAIGQVFRRLSRNRAVPKPKSDRTYHLMAKAAVTVFESVPEEREIDSRD
jgi:tRNA(His) 5'-end guanylyltransferase